MKRMLKRIGALLLCALLLLSAAMAEDCFTIDVDTLDLDNLNNDDYVARALSAGTQGVRVRKRISESSEVAANVRLTLTQMDTHSLLSDKNYGYQSGTFDSDVIYLPYVSDRTIPYLVTLYVGDYVYAMPFMHQQRRMEANSACTVGVRLRDLGSSRGGDWLMGTMVDLDDLRRMGSCTVDVCASNSYLIGTATISLQGSSLQVTLDFAPSADVELEDAELYVVTDGGDLAGARSTSAYSSVNVGGASSALVYLPMQVSYDPAGLPVFRYDGQQAASQQALWNETHAADAEEDGWQELPQESVQQDGWDDGWSSGWDDGWDDGWSSGW